MVHGSLTRGRLGVHKIQGRGEFKDRLKSNVKGTSQIAGRKSCQEEEEDLIWFLVPVGLRVVAIQHEKTGFYIAMNSDAKIFASVRIFILSCNRHLKNIL